MESLALDAKGPDGQDLTIDIVWIGSPTPERVIVHSSGLHGVEGYAGSAIQLQLLRTLPVLPPNAAIVVVHVLNPFGMAWSRRVNEENVDLNRNSIFPPDTYAGAPEMYARLDPLLNPPSAPQSDAFLMKVAGVIFRHGFSALKQAVAGGQYEFPRGLFFGGKRLQQSLVLYRRFLQNRVSDAKQILVLDAHTGLGKYGKDILLVDSDRLVKASQIFGNRVVPLDPQRSAAYRVRGGLQSLIFGLNTTADVSFVGQEFGTYHPVRIIQVLREENRWHQFGNGKLDHPSKRQIKQMFCPDDEAWKQSVLARGKEALDRGFHNVFTPDRHIHI